MKRWILGSRGRWGLYGAMFAIMVSSAWVLTTESAFAGPCSPGAACAFGRTFFAEPFCSSHGGVAHFVCPVAGGAYTVICVDGAVNSGFC